MIETNKRTVILYDMSIAEIGERASKAVVFPSMQRAAAFLGYAPNKISDRVGIGKFATHRGNGKKYAIRFKNSQ